MTTLKSMSIIQCAKEISIKHEETLLMMLLTPLPPFLNILDWKT